MLLDELGQCSWSCAFKDVVFGQEVTGTCRISLTAAVMSRKCCSPLQHSAVLTDGKPSLRRRVPHTIELGDSHRRLTNLLKDQKQIAPNAAVSVMHQTERPFSKNVYLECRNVGISCERYASTIAISTTDWREHS